MNKTYTAIIIAALLIIGVVMYNECNRPANPVIYTPIPTQSTVKIVVDSLRGIKQEISITSDKGLISVLQDSIQRILNRNASLKPTIIIKYKETFSDDITTGSLRDSLSKVIDNLLSKMQDKTMSNEEFESYKATLLAKKIPYKIENRYRYETGSIDYDGNIISDTLTVKSEPLISFGETTRFLKRPLLTVSVANTNPLVINSGLTSVAYVPKDRIRLGMGPIVLFNKNQVAGGVGITIKKGIFSVSVGYMLVNTNK